MFSFIKLVIFNLVVVEIVLTGGRKPVASLDFSLRKGLQTGC
jgi:hypothetical protein